MAVTTGPTPRTSRAVGRPIDPGSDVECVRCGERVKFVARTHGRQVIANVYDEGQWQRVEHFHAECYAEAGEPWGAPAA